MRFVFVLVAAVVTFTAGSARAAEASADELIVRGLELRRSAKPAEALEVFQRAHAMAPSPRTLGQLGLVETSLERWLDAERHLMAALVTPSETWVRKNRAFLDQALKVCRGHIGELIVTGPNGTDISVDGRRVGRLPFLQPLRLVDGTTVVTANSAGFKDFAKTVTIAGGAKVSVAIVLDPVEGRASVAVAAPVPLPAPASSIAAVPANVESEPSARSWKTSAGVGLVAAGAGLLAWGITWMAVDYKDNCPSAGPACNDVYDTGTKGRLLTAGGVAAAGAGTVLLYLGRRSVDGNLTFDLTPSSVSLRGRF